MKILEHNIFKVLFISLNRDHSNFSLCTYFRVFCTRNPATIPIVVGRDAAQTPSLFNVLSSIFEATTRGGAHYRVRKLQSTQSGYQLSVVKPKLNYCWQ